MGDDITTIEISSLTHSCSAQIIYLVPLRVISIKAKDGRNLKYFTSDALRLDHYDFFQLLPRHAFSQMSVETAPLFLNHYSIQCDSFELGKQSSCLHWYSSTLFTLDESGDLYFLSWYTFHNSIKHYVLNDNLWNANDMNIK